MENDPSKADYIDVYIDMDRGSKGYLVSIICLSRFAMIISGIVHCCVAHPCNAQLTLACKDKMEIRLWELLLRKFRTH